MGGGGLHPSHGRAFTAEEVDELLEARVGPVGHLERRGPGALPLDRIVTEVADREAVVRALDDELAGGRATGFLPSRADGTLTVSFVSVVAHAAR